MLFQPSGKPGNKNTLGLLGYLIVANKQVHSYQLDALEEYLQSIELCLNDTVLCDIIDGRESSISYTSSLTAFEEENATIQRDLLYMLLLLSLVDDSIDKDEESVINDALSSSNINADEFEIIKKQATTER